MVSSYLCHHGVKGQRWGVRKYQNEDGSLTTLGREHYGVGERRNKAGEEQTVKKNKISKKALIASIGVGAGIVAAYAAVKYTDLIPNIATNSMNAGKLTIIPTKKRSGISGSSKTTDPLFERVISPFKKAGAMQKAGIDSDNVDLKKLFTKRKLTDDGVFLEKGTIVQHVMMNPDKDISQMERLFVAYTEADKKNYAGFFASLTQYRNKADKMYTMEIETLENIVSPSTKERVNMFMESFKDNPVKVSTQLGEFNVRHYDPTFRKLVNDAKKKNKDVEESELIRKVIENNKTLYNELVLKESSKYKKMSSKKLKTKAFYEYANSWFDPDVGTLHDMETKLKAKGYNAIVDDNDKRSYIQSQLPLIIFDTMQNLKTVSVTELSKQQINKNMIDWQNMKHSQCDENYLQHYGIKGQKKGIRRYENYDGTLTPVGKERYKRTSSETLSKFKTIRKNKDDLSKVSDADLSKKVARANLEKKYREMEENKNAKVNTRALAREWEIEDLKAGSEISSKASSVLNSVASVQRKNEQRKNSAKLYKAMQSMNLENVSDKDLQAAVNRMNLERNYKTLSAASVNTGKIAASDVIETIGAVATVTGGVLGIAASIKALKR